MPIPQFADSPHFLKHKTRDSSLPHPTPPSMNDFLEHRFVAGAKSQHSMSMYLSLNDRFATMSNHLHVSPAQTMPVNAGPYLVCRLDESCPWIHPLGKEELSAARDLFRAHTEVHVVDARRAFCAEAEMHGVDPAAMRGPEWDMRRMLVHRCYFAGCVEAFFYPDDLREHVVKSHLRVFAGLECALCSDLIALRSEPNAHNAVQVFARDGRVRTTVLDDKLKVKCTLADITLEHFEEGKCRALHDNLKRNDEAKTAYLENWIAEHASRMSL
ncbi:hypothetical protein HDZ31DRAFT_62485 [Schizophyllum fasciatum]